MLEIQKFLRENGSNSISLLEELYGIKHKRHSKYPDLISFKYNQLSSPFGEKIVQEARGIILDESANWNIVAKGFNKFFNYGESNAANIDWLTAKVQEKLDGTLILLYYYNNEWQVATSGTPDAGGKVNNNGLTFAELFWNVVAAQKIRLNYLSTNYTWVFELCTPVNKIVVPHIDSKLWLLSSFYIHGDSVNEVLPDKSIEKTVKVYIPQQYPLYSLDDCLFAASQLNPLVNEGFVVVDKFKNRVKIKSPAYVMLHHAKDELSVKRMCDIIRKGEQTEFQLVLDSLPEHKVLFNRVVQLHENAAALAENLYQQYKDIKDQKKFALKVKDSGYSSLLFMMRKNKQSALECLSNSKITLESYMKIIGIKNET